MAGTMTGGKKAAQTNKEKYGEDSVAQIITFNKLAPRGVLKDVGRVLNFPYKEINDLTSLSELASK